MSAENSTDSGRWYTAKYEGNALLGAHLPSEPTSDEASFTVFWAGRVPPSKFRGIVQNADQLFARIGINDERLIAFGPSREVVGPVHGGLADWLSPGSKLYGFEAYRAEFRGETGQLTLWANVTEFDRRSLDDGGENIGVCVTPALFKQARPLIADAIQDTQGLKAEVVAKLLDDVSWEMLGAASR